MRGKVPSSTSTVNMAPPHVQIKWVNFLFYVQTGRRSADELFAWLRHGSQSHGTNDSAIKSEQQLLQQWRLPFGLRFGGELQWTGATVQIVVHQKPSRSIECIGRIAAIETRTSSENEDSLFDYCGTYSRSPVLSFGYFRGPYLVCSGTRCRFTVSVIYLYWKESKTSRQYRCKRLHLNIMKKK